MREARRHPTHRSVVNSHSRSGVIERHITDTVIPEDVNGPTAFTPTEALNCLRSVPFSADDATELIETLRHTNAWYAGQAFYKVPIEPLHELPAFDVDKTIDGIEAKVKSGHYKNGFDFFRDIGLVQTSYRDMHTSFYPACGDYYLFKYTHDYPLVAVSDTAVGTRGIYTLKRNGTTAKPKLDKQVETINRLPAEEFLIRLASDHPDLWMYHDPDTRFNMLFENYPWEQNSGIFNFRQYFVGEEEEKLEIGFVGGEKVQVQWKAYFQNLELQFNSTEELIQNVCYLSAEELKPLSPKVAGPLWKEDPSGALWSSAFSPEVVEKRTAAPFPATTATDSPATATDSAETSATPTTSIVGYPTPVSRNEDESLVWFQDPDGDNETVILRISTFDIEETDSWSLFLNTTLQAFHEKGAKRLIIDVSGNGGGTAILAKRFVRVLFPDLFDGTDEPDYYANMRYHSALDKVWKAEKDFDPENLQHTLLNEYVNLNGTNFTTFDEVLGPYRNVAFNDSFTAMSLWRPDLDKTDFGSNSEWSKENIIIVGAGQCASTCHNWMELMRNVGVRTYTFGGRANSTAMQPVGGTKSGTVHDFKQMVEKTWAALGDTTNYKDVLKYPRARLVNTRIGIENQFRLGENNSTTAVPLFFRWSPGCKKLPYSKTTVNDPAEMWRAAKAAAWTTDGKATECDKQAITPPKSGEETPLTKIGKVIWEHIHFGPKK